MKKAFFGLALALACSTASAGEPIKALVLDSGSDFSHARLAPLALPNAVEAAGQAGVDDDSNGYADDVFGWNFVDNSATLVDLTSTPPNYDHILECMRLLGILQAHGKEALTPAEFQYLVKAYNDKKVWAWVGFTGGWAHGTHCAGILSTDNPEVKLNAVHHINTGQAPKEEAQQAVAQIRSLLLHERVARPRVRRPEASTATASDTSPTTPPTVEKLTLEQLEAMFVQLGENYAAKVAKEASYLGTFKARVINCSFGSENKSLCVAFKQNMVEEWGWVNPSDAEVQQVVNLFVGKALLARDKALFGACKEALFCIAAGNSSEDLDDIVTSPNEVPIENKLVVAATEENKKLAAFSCHGVTKVDVAVPGVNIFATYPNGKMGFMSGTSMACPMAARYASLVMQAHDGLSAVEVKQILMGTVDKKDWLADKVRSGGVINPGRAIHAAKLVKEGKSLEAAIAEAGTAVSDVTIRRSRFKGPNLSDKQVRELYFSGVF